MFDGGISRESDLIELGSQDEVVQKSGAWYSYGETRLGQGKETARRFLLGHPEMANEIELAVFERRAPNLLERRREHLEQMAEVSKRKQGQE